jgi:hypothetical protein
MPINDVLTKIIAKEGHNKELTPYLMSKYTIKQILLESIMKEG